MKGIGAAAGTACRLDELASRDIWINAVHPLAKLAVTLAYIVAVVSFDRLEAAPLCAAAAYPACIFALADLSFRECARRLVVVMPFVCMMAITCPIIEGRDGIAPMIVLIQKGVLAALASYALIATTSMDRLCSALTSVGLPSVIAVEVMLMHRYLTLLLREASRVWSAYSLRAPRHRGVGVGAWGSLVGMMLLRAFDRAEDVWSSMSLRGFDGDFSHLARVGRFRPSDAAYAGAWIAAFAALRATSPSLW